MSILIRNPYHGPGQFRKAQLHCHTTASDGRFPPDELLRKYQEAGYTFVCITDHNRVTHAPALNSDRFLAIPGTEDTVSRLLRPLGPHMGRLFVDAPLRNGSPQERIDHTRAAGGLVSLCHPSWTGNLWTGAWTESIMANLRGVHLVEIWNPHSHSPEDVRRWVAALRAQGNGHGSWGVAVDDCHRQEQFNRGWIAVKVPEISSDAFRDALRAGAFYASTGPTAEFAVDGPHIEVMLVEPGRIEFLDQDGRTRSQATGIGSRYALEGDETYVRVEGETGSGHVWSQPFWLEHP